MSNTKAQDSGACCFISYCIDLPFDDCDMAGGNWYDSSFCADLVCPAGCIEQLPYGVNGLFSDLYCDHCGPGVQLISDNFMFADPIRADNIVFFGNVYPSLQPSYPDCFDIIFRADNGGVPGDEVYRISCINPGRVEISTSPSRYLYFADISEYDVEIEPGLVHLEIYNNTENDPDTWFWNDGSVGQMESYQGSAWSVTYPEEPWSYDFFTEMAFILGGDCNTLAVHEISPRQLPSIISYNYPNPFNASTLISFSLQKSQYVNLNVYDLLGRKIAVLANENMPAGKHNITFDASDLASGIYYYRLQAGDLIEFKSMTLLK